MMQKGAFAFLLAITGCDDPSAEAESGYGDKAERTTNPQARAGPQEGIDTSVVRLDLPGSTYVIPAGHVVALREDPRFFVRIKPSESAFTLVYDSRPDEAGEASGAPRIFSVNDGDYPNIDYHSGPHGIIVCRRASAPMNGCGMTITHGRAEWQVLFAPASREVADEIADEARAVLDSYGVPPEAAPSPSET